MKCLTPLNWWKCLTPCPKRWSWLWLRPHATILSLILPLLSILHKSSTSLFSIQSCFGLTSPWHRLFRAAALSLAFVTGCSIFCGCFQSSWGKHILLICSLNFLDFFYWESCIGILCNSTKHFEIMERECLLFKHLRPRNVRPTSIFQQFTCERLNKTERFCFSNIEFPIGTRILLSQRSLKKSIPLRHKTVEIYFLLVFLLDNIFLVSIAWV